MTSGIFIIQNDDQLIELTEKEYDSEAILQGLLAKHPGLSAGKQIDNISPRRWLLISREMPVPTEEGGGGGMALDHLFLDQDAIPTLVEVKRSTVSLPFESGEHGRVAVKIVDDRGIESLKVPGVD